MISMTRASTDAQVRAQGLNSGSRTGTLVRARYVPFIRDSNARRCRVPLEQIRASWRELRCLGRSHLNALRIGYAPKTSHLPDKKSFSIASVARLLGVELLYGDPRSQFVLQPRTALPLEW